MNDSKSKKKLLGILGATALMTGGLSPHAYEMGEQIAERRAEEERKRAAAAKKPEVQPSPQIMLQFLDQCVVNIARKVMEWNNTSSPKLKAWDVYGFEIKGTTISNATKRLRKFQAQCKLQPGITSDQIDAERIRLKELVAKTTQSKGISLGEEE